MAFAKENPDKACKFFCVDWDSVNPALDDNMKSGYAPNWFCCKKDGDTVAAMADAQPGSAFIGEREKPTALSIMGLE